MYLKAEQNCVIKGERLQYADLKKNLLIPGTNLKAAASDAELSLNGYNNPVNK